MSGAGQGWTMLTANERSAGQPASAQPHSDPLGSPAAAAVAQTRFDEMELGLTIPHTGRLASPQFVRDVAQAADELGYGSIWAIDHVVMPTHFESLYTLGRKPARLAD